MSLVTLTMWLAVFLIAGSVACLVVMRSFGFGIAGNIVVGALGWFVGDALSSRLGLFAGGSPLWDIVSATVGAVVSLFLIGAALGALLSLTVFLWKMEALSRL